MAFSLRNPFAFVSFRISLNYLQAVVKVELNYESVSQRTESSDLDRVTKFARVTDTNVVTLTGTTILL